jgi:hypothetical protein
MVAGARAAIAFGMSNFIVVALKILLAAPTVSAKRRAVELEARRDYRQYTVFQYVPFCATKAYAVEQRSKIEATNL